MEQFDTKEAIALLFVGFAFAGYLRVRVLGLLESRLPANLSDISQVCKSCMLLESELRKVRQNLPASASEHWKAFAIISTDFEFENFLVNEVWGSHGKRVRNYRLGQSPYKHLIKQLEKTTKYDLEHAY